MDKIVSHLKEGFPNLNSEDLELLAHYMTAKVIPQYQTLYRKADSSGAFYVIKSGRISLADEDARPLFTLTAGNVLGEQEFFRGEPYALTSRAEIETACWEMTIRAFQEVLQARPVIGVRIADGPVVQMVPYLQEKLARVSALDNVSPDVLADMAHMFKAQTLLAEDRLYNQGDAAQGLFLVDRGQLVRLHGTGVPSGEIAPGTLLGVDQLSTDSTYDHSVMAQNHVLYWSLSRRDFQRLNTVHPMLVRALTRVQDSSLPPLRPADPHTVELLGQVPVLTPLGQPIWEGMAARSLGHTVSEGDTIYRIGDPSNVFFLVLSGEIELTTASAIGVNQELDRVTAGGVFGLESLLRGTPRTNQAAATQNSTLRLISRDELQKLGQIQPIVTQWLNAGLQAGDVSSGLTTFPTAELGDLSMFGIFTGLTGAELASFPTELEVATFYPQEYIYQAGETLDRMYLLQRGTVLLALNDRTAPRYVQPGAILDLFALMSQTPCRETASASTDVRLITLPHAAVMRFVAEIPRFGSNLWQFANAGMTATAEPVAPAPAQGFTPAVAPVVPGPVPPMPAPIENPYGQVPVPGGQSTGLPYPIPAPTEPSLVSPQPQIQDAPSLDVDPFAGAVGNQQNELLPTLSIAGAVRAALILLGIIWLVVSFVFFADSPAQWLEVFSL